MAVVVPAAACIAGEVDAAKRVRRHIRGGARRIGAVSAVQARVAAALVNIDFAVPADV